MKPDQAAKVLREHNAWRRRGSMDRMPHSAQTIGHAIDAAVIFVKRCVLPGLPATARRVRDVCENDAVR